MLMAIMRVSISSAKPQFDNADVAKSGDYFVLKPQLALSPYNQGSRER